MYGVGGGGGCGYLQLFHLLAVSSFLFSIERRV